MLLSDETDVAPPPPSIFKIYGERCSGTNFVETLIQQNLPGLKSGRRYNWEKHNFVNPPFTHDEQIAVVVVRDAFDWLRSLYRSPHQVGYWYRDVDFSGFLRHEWSSIFNGFLIQRQRQFPVRLKEVMYERHPMTGARIENVIALCNLKIQSQLKVRNLYRNWVILRFEDARADPEAVIRKLADHFDLKMTVPFLPVKKDVSNYSLPGDVEGKGRTREYAKIAKSDSKFVLDTLDLEQEKIVGYVYA